MASKRKTPWYQVYSTLSQAILKFYNGCKVGKKNPGEELFKICQTNTDFLNQNRWIDKFNNEFAVKSLDPIHIFSSISANRQNNQNRTQRINILLEIFQSQPVKKQIDFTGCPTPAATKLMSIRRKKEQQEIWELFSRVCNETKRSLSEADVKRAESWYGVDYSSFTIFLFWVNSNQFLPVETNIRTFIVAAGVQDKAPRNYVEYILLLNKLDKLNYLRNNVYGSKGIFRELAHIAYQVIGEGKGEVVYSKRLSNLFVTSEKPTKKEPRRRKVDNRITNIGNLGFKLIAIRALKNCDANILNILSKDRLYYFEKTIEIKAEEIIHHADRDIDLFTLKNGKRLNFTAVVGKNGTGKSSLIELLFRIINNISYEKRKSLKTEDLSYQKGLSAELFYIHSGILYKLVVNDLDIKIQGFELKSGKFAPIFQERTFVKEDLHEFFYTIAVNYSHYSLNSIEVGNWIAGLFHKNDSYQAPIVINPMRTEGIIDINRENELVSARLIANLLSPVAENDLGIRQITEKQKAIKITFTLNVAKNKVLYNNERNVRVLFSRYKGDKEKIWTHVKHIFDIPTNQNERNIAIKEVKKYIIRKLIKIAITYYKSEGYFDVQKIDFVDDKLIVKYIKRLKRDSSHITYKLKQAINYWKYNNLWPKEKSFELDISKDSDRLASFISSIKGKDLIEYIPPSIFSSEIMLSEVDGSESQFKKLSSGEKQLIHSVSSLLYHLKNIDSVEAKRGLISYRSVNILLDEIELYYHPELQRGYIDYLISMVNRIDIPNIDAINFCLVTHSPYILSDIPENFTLRMTRKTDLVKTQKTFGANVHDLLAHDFFMSNGFMGEHAKKKITEVLQFLNYNKLKKQLNNALRKRENGFDKTDELQVEKFKQDIIKFLSEYLNKSEDDCTQNYDSYIENIGFLDKEYYLSIIQVVGEPVLANKLREMYYEIYPLHDNDMERQLKELAVQLNYNLIKKN